MMPRPGKAIIYAYCAPVDMRKHFEGLAALVREEMGKDPLSGALFLFTNRRRSHAKILWFDGSDMCVLAKRLERGRFAALWEHNQHTQLPLRRERAGAVPRRQPAGRPLSGEPTEVDATRACAARPKVIFKAGVGIRKRARPGHPAPDRAPAAPRQRAIAQASRGAGCRECQSERAPEQLALELSALQEQMARLQKQLYGVSSERRPKAGTTGDESARIRRGHGPTPEQRLPIEPVVVTIAPEECVCDHCGGSLKAIEGATEDSQRVTVVERKFVVQ